MNSRALLRCLFVVFLIGSAFTRAEQEDPSGFGPTKEATSEEKKKIDQQLCALIEDSLIEDSVETTSAALTVLLGECPLQGANASSYCDRLHVECQPVQPSFGRSPELAVTRL